MFLTYINQTRKKKKKIYPKTYYSPILNYDLNHTKNKLCGTYTHIHTHIISFNVIFLFVKCFIIIQIYIFNQKFKVVLDNKKL